jgi:hypothetical protein
MMERRCFGVSPPDADAAAAIGSGEAVRGRPFSKLLERVRSGGVFGVFFPAFRFGGGMVEEEAKKGMEWAFSALLDWRPK